MPWCHQAPSNDFALAHANSLLAHCQGPLGDQRHRLLPAHSPRPRRGRHAPGSILRILQWGASAPVIIEGKMYSKYGVGLVLILLPLVLLGKALAFLPGITENLATGFLISFYNIPFALGTLWLLYETCRRLDLTENRARLVVYATAIGTMFWKYTVTDYSQVTQGFFLMGTVHFLLRGRAGGHLPGIGLLRWTHRDEAGQCRALGSLPPVPADPPPPRWT